MAERKKNIRYKYSQFIYLICVSNKNSKPKLLLFLNLMVWCYIS